MGVEAIKNFIHGSRLQVRENQLAQRDGWNAFYRDVIPGYAYAEDQAVTAYFLTHIKALVAEREELPNKQIAAFLDLADQHIEGRLGQRKWNVIPPSDIAELERYILGIRTRIGVFDPQLTQRMLQTLCRSHNPELYAKWVDKQGYSREAFFSCPDLVDLVFATHLHRHISYSDYGHTVGFNGKEGTLMIEGAYRPWSEIRKKISIDPASGRLVSLNQKTERVFWDYYETGLIEWDRKKVAVPRHFKILDKPPPSCQIQIVTTHESPEKQNITDRVMKGTRHTFFRVIFREGFDHPHFIPGGVYSFGWAMDITWDQFNIFRTLESFNGMFENTDHFEFSPQNMCVTTEDISDAKALKVMELVRKYSESGAPFNIVTQNCAKMTAEILREADIADISTSVHMTTLWYRFLVPRCIRRILDAIGTFFIQILPKCVVDFFTWILKGLHSVLLAPIFSLFGAWKARAIPDGGSEREAERRVRALFSNLFDVLNPEKMSYDLTLNVYKWQKKQGSKTFFIRDCH